MSATGTLPDTDTSDGGQPAVDTRPENRSTWCSTPDESEKTMAEATMIYGNIAGELHMYNEDDIEKAQGLGTVFVSKRTADGEYVDEPFPFQAFGRTALNLQDSIIRTKDETGKYPRVGVLVRPNIWTEEGENSRGEIVDKTRIGFTAIEAFLSLRWSVGVTEDDEHAGTGGGGSERSGSNGRSSRSSSRRSSSTRGGGRASTRGRGRANDAEDEEVNEEEEQAEESPRRTSRTSRTSRSTTSRSSRASTSRRRNYDD